MNLKAVEKDKIKGAVRTDFILSAEIIAITLGTVADKSFGMQFAVLTVVALMVTVGVYGLVAGIVKLDDAGLYLSQKASAFAQKLGGQGILWLAPWMMKTLSVLGTIAMFLVGGGILTHGIPAVYGGAIHHVAGMISSVPEVLVTTVGGDGLFGLLAGAILVLVITPVAKLWERRAA